ncbi:hypothetical protein [Chitinophaga agri]|uniref:Uncharacterized protein n=1 Tax=Chitinophaga agri TaxID=2703787 RepID=A0A6B9ZI24_9BACT|nr:hypothetical protein [Chitinophaga agri]QHS61151.1 hypothetical protein GWR21_16555 [Chitinophaga agri]
MARQGKDLLNTTIKRYTIGAYRASVDAHTKPVSRVVKLTFTRHFGNQQVKGAAGRRTDIEDAKRRRK